MRSKFLASIIAFALLSCLPTFVHAQCTGGGNSGSITPAKAFQTKCIQGGNYVTFNAVAGLKYLFSFCQGGGSYSFDTEITIRSSDGSVSYVYNDDNCGQGSEVYFTAPATATYRVLITQYTCTTSGGCSNMAYKIYNDDICYAHFLNPRCTASGYTEFTTTYASNSPQANPGCASYGGRDIWFSTIVPYSGDLRITSTSGVVTDGALAVYRATSCTSALTMLDCDDDDGPGSMPEINLTGLTPGDSLFIRFWEYGNDVVGTFNIAVFDADPFYCMMGSATQIFPGGCIQITPNTNGQNATVWNRTQIDMSQDFEYVFTVNLGSNDGGADGLAFTMQNNAAGMAALGNPGYQLGIAPVTNSVIIEFDTFNNGAGVSDVAEDHTAITLNGNIATPSAGPIQCSSTSANIEDGLNHNVRVTWSPSTQTLSVYFDGVFRLSYTGDLITNVFGGNNLVYWGFSGSTGAFTNTQSICPGSLPGAPMPVEWSTFTVAKINSQEVLLEWSTAKENYTDEFIIERMDASHQFVSIGSVKAAENSSSTTNYRFTDSDPQEGTIYYRLKQTDLDGQYSYSPIKSVTFDNDKMVDIYPNPLKRSERLMIHLCDAQGAECTLVIYDQYGHEHSRVKIAQGSNSVQLDDSFAAGVYHAVVKTEEDSYSQAIIITGE